MPSGIYKITNLKNGRIYVGQSENIYIRRKQHFLALEKGRHKNILMQKDWKTDYKYFKWEVIEFCPLEILNERESYWIEKLQSQAPKGYNQGWIPYTRKKKVAKRRKIGYHKTS